MIVALPAPTIFALAPVTATTVGSDDVNWNVLGEFVEGVGSVKSGSPTTF